MSEFEESLGKIVGAQARQGQRYFNMRALMGGLRQAIENSLADALQKRHPVTSRPLVEISKDRSTEHARISIKAFDGNSLDFRLRPTGVLEVSTPEFSADVVELRPRGGSAGMTDADFVTAENRRFGLRDLLDRFFKTVLDDLEGA